MLGLLDPCAFWKSPCIRLISTPLRSDEQTVLDFRESDCDAQVACHEPSKLQPERNLVLITQEVWQHLDSEQDITLLFPPKGLVMALCARLPSDEKTIRVVMETTNYASMWKRWLRFKSLLETRTST